MTYEELAHMKTLVGIEMARKILASANFAHGLDLLTQEQRDAYEFIEALYYEGEITYRQLWAMCPMIPLPEE